ncbi:MAG: hypothetical protein COY66_00405 [Candidatus Kerfeldbacteria bacterium CG_4_10_14_0_8_um_filter_42_10]|uniref:Uncharacterized protein n=1 Tax=Candidatus Kerfeldbacteria bacterium CG_4_10_14_0_8_um_filter_42_10 TaxID=2014248 RepID=A0A2M7RL63_9BACT|nr:MAG: hypothetical protein COY66_00405 [Candidatus Kerfeldbacteria bacterium CG_4_10_14_0_8_um_filter_42_10]
MKKQPFVYIIGALCIFCAFSFLAPYASAQNFVSKLGGLYVPSEVSSWLYSEGFGIPFFFVEDSAEIAEYEKEGIKLRTYEEGVAHQNMLDSLKWVNTYWIAASNTVFISQDARPDELWGWLQRELCDAMGKMEYYKDLPASGKVCDIHGRTVISFVNSPDDARDFIKVSPYVPIGSGLYVLWLESKGLKTSGKILLVGGNASDLYGMRQ